MTFTPGVTAYYESLLSIFSSLDQAVMLVTFGNEIVSVETPRSARLASFTQTLSHLKTDGSSPPQSRLIVIFREDNDVLLSPIRWEWNSPRVWEDEVTCQFFSSSDSVLFWNSHSRVHILVLSRVTEHLLTRPEFMRLVLQGFLAELSLDSVHGGTLGHSNTGVLITNRGGSGKSSLVAAGVMQGYQSLGDDFLLINSAPARADDNELFSVFRTLKLAESSPSWPDYSPHILEKGESKDLFFLDSIAPAAMTPRQQIAAIVIPTVGEKFSFTELDVASVIRALVPNSLAMGLHPARTLRALDSLTSNLPLFSMVVTHDVEQGLQKIAELLKG